MALVPCDFGHHHHDAMTFNMPVRGKTGVLRPRITRTTGQDEGMRGLLRL